jgi:hypothetical protein
MVANMIRWPAADAADSASACASRMFGDAEWSEKFAQFRAIRLVRREISVVRRNAEFDAFTCWSECLVGVVRSASRHLRCMVRIALYK